MSEHSSEPIQPTAEATMVFLSPSAPLIALDERADQRPFDANEAAPDDRTPVLQLTGSHVGQSSTIFPRIDHDPETSANSGLEKPKDAPDSRENPAKKSPIDSGVVDRHFTLENLRFVGKFMFSVYNKKGFNEILPSEADAGLKYLLRYAKERTEMKDEDFRRAFREILVEYVKAHEILELGLGPLMMYLQSDQEFSSALFESMRNSLGDASNDLARKLFQLFDIDESKSVSVEEIMEIILFFNSDATSGTFFEVTESVVDGLFRFLGREESQRYSVIHKEEITELFLSFLSAFESLCSIFFRSLKTFVSGDPLARLHAKVCTFLWEDMYTSDSHTDLDASEIPEAHFLHFLLRNWSDPEENWWESQLFEIGDNISIPKLHQYVSKIQVDLECMLSEAYGKLHSEFQVKSSESKKGGTVSTGTCVEFTSKQVIEVIDKIKDLCLEGDKHVELKSKVTNRLLDSIEQCNIEIKKYLKKHFIGAEAKFQEAILFEAFEAIFLRLVETLKADTARKMTNAVLLFLDANDDDQLDIKEFDELAKSFRDCYAHGMKAGLKVEIEGLLHAIFCLADKDSNNGISRDEIRNILDKCNHFIFAVISALSTLLFAVLKQVIKSSFELIFHLKVQTVKGEQSELTKAEVMDLAEKTVPLFDKWTSLMNDSACGNLTPGLEESATINELSRCEQSALHIAAYYGRSEIVKSLLNAKGMADCEDKKGRTPLDLAESAKTKANMMRWAQGQVDFEACANILKQHGSNGWTDLMIVAEQGKTQEVVKLLRRNKTSDEHSFADLLNCDVQVQNKYGLTALHVAVKSGYFGTCEELIKARANPLSKDRHGMTPLDMAISDKGPNRLEMVELLVKNVPDLKSKDIRAMSEVEDFCSAVKTNNLSKVKKILDQKNFSLYQRQMFVNNNNLSGISSFHVSLTHARFDLCKLLINAQADLTATRAGDGENLIFKILTSRRSSSEISRFLKEIPEFSVVDIQTHISQEIFEAVERNQLNMVEKLLRRAIKPSWKEKCEDNLTILNWKHSCGMTALHSAAAAGFTDICRALIRAGADPNILTECEPDSTSGSDDKELFTYHPRSSTTSTDESAEKGAGHYMINTIEKSDSSPRSNMIRAVQPNCSALYLAAEQGHTEVCKALLMAKADPNLRIRVSPINQRHVGIPCIVHIAQSVSGCYDGVYLLNKNSPDTKAIYENLFDERKQLICLTEVDPTKLSIRRESIEGSQDSTFGPFEYTQNEEVSWSIVKSSIDCEEDCRDDCPLIQQDSKASAPNIFESSLESRKLSHVTTTFELFTPLHIAAVQGYAGTCREILLFLQQTSESGFATRIHVPDVAIEISGAGEFGANGVYFKKSVKDGDERINAKRAETPTIIYTHVYDEDYRLQYSDTYKSSSWALVKKGITLYRVGGKADVNTLIFGSWIVCAALYPTPVAEISNLRKEQIIKRKMVSHDIFFSP
jgi:ankyrin repeat protein